jgi:predicted DNA-binding ribbon-helix-helix protein
MKSLVVKRAIVIAGHKTSVSLEDVFWKAIVRGTTLSNLVSSIDSERKRGNSAACLREAIFGISFFRTIQSDSASSELRELIRRMSRENRLWRAVHICVS